MFGKHPCDSALTNEQLTTLLGMVPPARHTDNAAGPGCGWTKESTAAIIDVGWMTGVGGGLSQVYQAQTTAKFQQPMDVNGYPALAYDPIEQPTERCDLAVGVADNLVFDAGFHVGDDRRGKVDPCDAAKQIAQDVLANLRAAAGK